MKSHGTFGQAAAGQGWAAPGVESPLGAGMDRTASLIAAGKRRRLNLVAIIINVLLPWLTFAGLYAAVSFSLHYRRPKLTWALVGAGFAASALAGYFAYRRKLRENDPMWYTFASLSLFLATVLAIVAGDMNFWYNMEPFYNIDNLNTYPSVNPAQQKGRQLMDAGRVYFAEGAQLDINKAIGFKNMDQYCVAPIVLGEEQLASYDFWAVGVNCCSGLSADFRCGEFDNPKARAGLRLMREDQRPFFRLAVQQAEAAYNIKAAHPVFFYWLQDPVAEMGSYRSSGIKLYLLGVFTHLAFNILCVSFAVLSFSKI